MIIAPFNLSIKQKMHVTLLYHFASLEYLKGLQQRVNSLISFIDPALDEAKLDKRDKMLTTPRWGTRNTSENWSNNAWPFLADFQRSIASDIAKRTMEVYSITDANNCARGTAEQSQAWMNPEDYAEFERRMDEVTDYAMNIDYTMDKTQKTGKWTDFILTEEEKSRPDLFRLAPALRLRTDVLGDSGKTPPRTGVYIPIDDPHGTPQFCWVGKPTGQLQESSTFNALGEAALTSVGRNSLWIDDGRMQAFVQDHIRDPALTSDSFFDYSIKNSTLCASLVARHAFRSRPCQWIFVEQIHGMHEDWSENINKTPVSGPRVAAGSPCPQPGYYFTPAKADSRRYFDKKESMPHVGGDYGETIWQWDIDQQP